MIPSADGAKLTRSRSTRKRGEVRTGDQLGNLYGNPLGSGMILWTLTLLVFDLAENRMIWRDYWFDWLVATGAVLVGTAWASPTRR